ncbi:MAG TPA: adenylate cyclase regulatory domain-containing protein [Solirubrobacteraceae bacterium]|nr:adenylate cyclase regulatory domain-containing protein [Solirubrobacteraceae bacterium]
MDFEAAGLLDGLENGERTARRRLLERLAADGVGMEELQTAVAEDRLALLPVERVLGGRYTAREIEARTGLPARVLLRLRRMLGLPEAGEDERLFGEEDVEMARSTRRFIDAGLGEPAINEMTRVLGESMARLAATTAAGFVDAFLKPGDSEEEVAVRFAGLAEEFTPLVHPVLVAAYNAHLREAVRRGMLGRAEREAGALADAQELAICFADLVGFTRMGAQIEAQELGGVAGKLAALAGEVAEPPVRLIKTIGDAAMFVSPEPGPLVAVALALVEAAQAAELPSLRAGLALGPALVRAGDYYGHSVNLASRVTGVARPDSVLCTQEIRDAAAEDFDWSFAGKHRLKGVREPVALHRARRPRAAQS